MQVVVVVVQNDKKRKQNRTEDMMMKSIKTYVDEFRSNIEQLIKNGYKTRAIF
jgi:hypothetical protein